VVIAEIGPQKITKADLDALMEAQLDRQLASMASFLSDAERRAQKAKMLKEYFSAKNRMQFLNQYIIQDILSRKARELRITEAPEVRSLLEDQQRALLAQEMIQREYNRVIHITPTDVETYYKAHPAEYTNQLENVQMQVYQALRSEKEREVQNRLLAELKEQYRVTIHQSALRGDQETPKKP
jgi:hypothetical protein